MQSFLDEARTESAWRARTPCSMGVLLASLPKAARAEVQVALEDDAITAAAIVRVLERRYPDVAVPKQAVVTRHRRNDCNCG